MVEQYWHGVKKFLKFAVDVVTLDVGTVSKDMADDKPIGLEVVFTGESAACYTDGRYG